MNNRVNEEVSRFSGAPWFAYARTIKVMVAGIGGIGSYAAYSISRFRPLQMLLVDPDSVQMGNMSGQMYSINDIGSLKTKALSDTLRRYSDMVCAESSTEIQDIRTQTIGEFNVIVCGFDSMEARRVLFGKWTSSIESGIHEPYSIFIDGRMDAETYQIFSICGNDQDAIDRYRKDYLFSDYEAAPTICSFKQTSFNAMQIGGMIGSIVANFCYNATGDVQRPVPFKVEFDSANIFMNIEE